MNTTQTTSRSLSVPHKYLGLIAVFALGLFVYWLGPKGLPTGNYSAQIDVTLEGDTLLVEYPFALGQQAGQPVVLNEMDGQYRLIIEGKDAYEYDLGQSITYRIRVTDSNGKPIHLGLDHVTSTIAGPNYRQILPPTSRSGEWLVFTTRIPYKAKISTALLFAVATLWLTELVPLAAGALVIPIVIVVATVTDARTDLQPFFHPIVVLFAAGFLLAEGMHRTGVDRVIALNILRRSSLEPAYLMLTMMGLTAFLSMWMSNTASVAILIPIALAVLEGIPGDISRTGFRRALGSVSGRTRTHSVRRRRTNDHLKQSILIHALALTKHSPLVTSHRAGQAPRLGSAVPGD